MKRLRAKLTYANVISTICLFLLLGGGAAFAATQLPKNSVGSKQIKKEAVSPAKLSTAAKATLTGPAGSKGATGAQGPKGDTGSKGEKGEKGDVGDPGTAVAYATITSSGIIETTSGSLNLSDANVTHTAGTGIYCFSGLPAATDAVIGGASNLFSTESDVVVSASYDLREPTSLSGCPADAEARVRTFDVSSAALADRPFDVWFEG